MLGRAGSTTGTVYVGMTLTQSKVKVKVTEHLNFRQLPTTAHFHVYLLRRFRVKLKLVVGGDSMGPGLQLVGARFFNFLLGKLSREFKLRPLSISHEIQMAVFR